MKRRFFDPGGLNSPHTILSNAHCNSAGTASATRSPTAPAPQSWGPTTSGGNGNRGAA